MEASQQELLDVSGQKDEINCRLTKVYATASWKVTAPMRYIGYLMKSFKEKRNASIVKHGKDGAVSEIEHVKKRILLVSYYCPTRAHAGGLRILDVYRHLKNDFDNTDIVLFTFKRPEIDWQYKDLEEIFDVVCFSDSEELSYKNYVEKSGDKEKFDVVDFQFLEAAEQANTYRDIAGKIIFTPMELMEKTLFDMSYMKSDNAPEHWINIFLLAVRELMCARYVDQIVCVSQSDADFLKKITATDNVISLDTCLSEIEFPEIKHGGYVRNVTAENGNSIIYVAYFGSDTNVKALHWFLDNIHPIIKQRVPDYVINVVGRGDLSSFSEYGDECIKLIGEVDALGDYIKLSKVGIAPVVYGAGFRGKINQYAIYHVPCVATNLATQGLKYRNGEDIFITDDSACFADYCCRLLLDKDLNKRMGDNANDTCMTNYTWNSKNEEIKNIYNL